MNPPKMPIHIGDLMRDTAHLRAMLFGSYLSLMFHHWSTGELPSDDDQLSAIARMSPAEWRKAKPILSKFFDEGWHHGRIAKDLETSHANYQKRAKAGAEGGKAKANTKQSSSKNVAMLESESSNALATFNLLPKKEDSDARASGATAPIDHRKRLFDEGLKKLAAMTGKGPDACRSFVGKCLKAASDDAVTVLGLIEEAERNKAVDPSGWIVARLKPAEFSNGKAKSGIIQAADDLCRKIASFDGPPKPDFAVRDGEGTAAPRLLSQR